MTHFIDTTSDCSAFHRELYNGMPDVQNADADIRRSGALDRALDVLAPIFQSFAVTDFCGINLLHKHWTVGSDEIPLQIRRSHANEYELLTQPSSIQHTAAMPSSWALQVDGTTARFVPFEFSTDTEVLRCAGLLVGKQEFFAAVAEALLTHHLFQYFGVGIVLREPLSENPRASLVEVSSSRKRASLVRPIELDETRPYIQTAWTFSSGDKKPPPKPKCQPTTVWYCELDNPPVGPQHHNRLKTTEHDPD